MKDGILKSVKYWWLSVLLGAVSIILGIWYIARPDVALGVTAIVFAIGFLCSGIAEIILAVSNRQSSNWGWSLAAGIIDTLLGIVLVCSPLITIFVLGFLIGFWLLFRSIWGIGASVELQQAKVSGWGWMLALAILGILASFAFLFSPVFLGGAFIVALASISFIVYGIFRISVGFKLKDIKKEIEEDEKL